MPVDKPSRKASARKRRLAEAIEVLASLQFGPKQRNETAAYTLLALLDLQPNVRWAEAQAPLCGITPIIDFIAGSYGVHYAPNTRETIRDDAVKFFVEEGLLLRNPDDPKRPTTSGKTVYQIEPSALALLRKLGTSEWTTALGQYLASRESLKHEIARKRTLVRVPVKLPDGSQVALSPGGQNPLIKAIIEQFCPAFAPGGVFFFTVVTHERRPILQGRDVLGCLREAIEWTRRRRPFAIDAIIVLPDHLHCIWSMPPQSADFTTRWRTIKGRFTRGFLRIRPPLPVTSESRFKRGEQSVWQRRFWEHLIRDERDYANHMDYIHFNPVKHGYVRCPHQWPYSSFHRWVREGVYRSDWCCVCENRRPCIPDFTELDKRTGE